MHRRSFDIQHNRYFVFMTLFKEMCQETQTAAITMSPKQSLCRGALCALAKQVIKTEVKTKYFEI